MNNSIGGVKNRREKALQRLQEDLRVGFKTPKGKTCMDKSEPLTDSDINRINKEIAILKTRV